MPGSGVLESRALLGFLPSLARRLLGEDLKMPQHRDLVVRPEAPSASEVLARLDEFAIAGALADGVPGFASHGPVLAGELVAAERDALDSRDRATAASITSARRWCGCRPRRAGTTAGSRRAPSCCASSRRRRPTAGA